jgi:uncharacterized protein with von Willebrand factor type A (vWA) domain
MEISKRIQLSRSGLAGRVIMFAGFLKTHGFKVFQSGVHDALKSLETIDLFHKTDFLAAFRSNLATGEQEWKRFEELFHEFWDTLEIEELCDSCNRDPEEAQKQEVCPGDSDINPLAGTDNEKPDQDNRFPGRAYSPLPLNETKDFGSFEKADVHVAHLALKKIAEPFRLQTYRHVRLSRRQGDMFFPRIMRESLKTDGVPVKLFYREKKRRLKRLVIIADVSGSMDRYTCLLIPFILGLRGIGSRAEAFVFSTVLTSVTFFIRHFSVEDALRKMSLEIPDWSGGTNIGESLRQFNREHGQRLLNNRTVVIILSDGWDLWPEILRRELSLLSSKVHRVIWLNPELAHPDSPIVAQGMVAALPYIDHFMPANNLESLKRVGRLLTQVMIH